MPSAVEREIARRGGAIRYRSFTRDGKLYRVAIVRKPGPRGGRTVEWEVRDRPRTRGASEPFWRWFFFGSI